MKYLFFLFLPPFAHFTHSQAVRLSVPRLHRSSRKAKSFSTQTQLNLFLASIHQSQGQNGPPSLPIQEPCSQPNHVRLLREIRNYTKVVKYTNYQLLHGFSSRKIALRFPTPQHFLLRNCPTKYTFLCAKPQIPQNKRKKYTIGLLLAFLSHCLYI